MAAPRGREASEGTSISSHSSPGKDTDKERMKRRTFEQEERTSSGEGEADRSPAHNDTVAATAATTAITNPSPPPLPDEPPPNSTAGDDGWQPIWDDTHQAYYFFNRFTGLTTWTNPRVPTVTAPGMALPEPHSSTLPLKIHNGTKQEDEQEEEGEEEEDREEDRPRKRPYGGYDPSVHGDYDPNADYAQEALLAEQQQQDSLAHPDQADPNTYQAEGTFNRFTGKWQTAALTPENFNDEHKSRRQMNAFFDVDAAANSHDGKSLKAERSSKKLSKKEVKAFKDKRRSKKEEKRRAWLRD